MHSTFHNNLPFLSLCLWTLQNKLPSELYSLIYVFNYNKQKLSMKLHKLIQTTTVLPGGQRKVNLGNKDKQWVLPTNHSNEVLLLVFTFW